MTREPANFSDEQVRRASERVLAEGQIPTAMLAKAMHKCEHIAVMRVLMVQLADMIVDAALDMKEVKGSKNVEAVGYDEKGRTLRVRFQGGRTYDYDAVPPETVADLWLAKSVGSFIHRRVKSAHEARAHT